MKCPYCLEKMNDGICENEECEHHGKVPPGDHILLAIPNRRVQGLRVGDIATDVLQTMKTAWVDAFGPFCPGSGREKDANAITKELENRLAKQAEEEGE